MSNVSLRCSLFTQELDQADMTNAEMARVDSGKKEKKPLFLKHKVITWVV